jgi:hypothetical protein
MKACDMLKKLAVACALILCSCQADPGHFRNSTLDPHMEDPSYIDVDFLCDPLNRTERMCSDLSGRLHLANNNQGSSAVFRGGLMHHVSIDGHIKVFGDGTSFRLLAYPQRDKNEVPVTFILEATPDYSGGSEHNGFIVARHHIEKRSKLRISWSGQRHAGTDLPS